MSMSTCVYFVANLDIGRLSPSHSLSLDHSLSLSLSPSLSFCLAVSFSLWLKRFYVLSQISSIILSDWLRLIRIQCVPCCFWSLFPSISLSLAPSISLSLSLWLMRLYVLFGLVKINWYTVCTLLYLVSETFVCSR